MLVPLTHGHWAIVDAADAVEVGQFNWTARIYPNGVYAYRRIHGKPPRVEYLHRFIASRAGMDLSHEIDHKDMNTSDDRRSNLRPATKGQQRCNQRMDPRNKSGVKGVVWNGTSWVGRVQVDRKGHYVGSFATIQEADLAVQAKRRELHGEFANDGKETLQ